MKFLVTGGGGFIGSNLALTLESKGHNVIIVDDFSSGNYKNLTGFKGRVISESILTVDLSQFEDVSTIFHCAAITDTTLNNKELMTSVNVNGFRRFIEFAIKGGKKFIYASSAAVYGNALGPISETMAGNPLNLYGVSKWQADCIAMEYIIRNKEQEANTQIIGLRYFNVFGNGEQFKGKMASMVWQIAHQMLSGRRPRIFKWGEQKRDQVYIKDVVRANLFALNAKSSAIVNIGSGQAITFNHIVEVLNRVLGTNFVPEYFDNPYTDSYQNYTQADLTLAKEVLGYTPEWSFEDAVRDYINELKTKDSLVC